MWKISVIFAVLQINYNSSIEIKDNIHLPWAHSFKKLH